MLYTLRGCEMAGYLGTDAVRGFYTALFEIMRGSALVMTHVNSDNSWQVHLISLDDCTALIWRQAASLVKSRVKCLLAIYLNGSAIHARVYSLTSLQQYIAMGRLLKIVMCLH